MAEEDLPFLTEPHNGFVSLFPLGEYRTIELTDIPSRTTLYLGENERLYEYGPAYIRSPYGDSIFIEDNLATIREVDVDQLEADELLLCRNLLWQVWLV